jgi:hypothetical protein
MEIAMTAAALLNRPRTSYLFVPALGVAWNCFGIYQFVSSTTASSEHLVAMGMTPEQAALYTGLPFWVTLAFGVGVLGGFVGSILLGLHRKVAIPVLIASLAGYLVLYLGDITEGIFTAFGTQQIAILTSVVLIAAVLLVFALHTAKRGRLV